jgi:imidazolonepropionase-like amidohydrolase
MIKKYKIVNQTYPGRKKLSEEEFYDLARLLIKAGYCVAVDTDEKVGQRKRVSLTYWENEDLMKENKE